MHEFRNSLQPNGLQRWSLQCGTVLPPRSNPGFTLIETLMALAILAVVVGVLVNVHLQTLRTESFSRLRMAAILQGDTILSQSLSGTEKQAIVDESGRQGWRVTAAPLTNGAAVNPGWTEWRVAATNAGAPVVTLYLRAGEVSKGSYAR